VSSGLHGIEGFFGSAVQLALIERWRTGPPAARVVLIHALNPYGLAWLRRTDDRNVDLNRNFLLEGERYAGAPPGYAALAPILNPVRLPHRWDPWRLRLLPVIARQGVSAVRRAIASGQYDHPHGLFFGGEAATPAHDAIRVALVRWLGGAEEIVHLDLHTGLGRRGEAQLLIDHPLTRAQREWLAERFDRGVVRMPDSSEAAYAARGGLGPWCAAQALARAYLFAYLEVGTFGGLHVLGGLRAENLAHHFGQPGDAATARAKKRLKEVFCPSDPQWRSRALARTVALVARAGGPAT
jgi:Protein of unknown function (DUF2817)